MDFYIAFIIQWKFIIEDHSGYVDGKVVLWRNLDS